jgi:hypothetical protein
MAVAAALVRSPETRAVQAALLAECAAGTALIAKRAAELGIAG